MMLQSKIFQSALIVLMYLACSVPSSLASSLPMKFLPKSQYSFEAHPDSSIGKGIPTIEIGPDQKLWLFQPPIVRGAKKRMLGKSGEIQTLDPGNGVLVNKHNIISEKFGTSENGAVFTREGKLLTFRTGMATATLRDSVDGKWFDDNDTVTTVKWPFGVLLTVGSSEPSPAAFGPKGTLYITVPRENKILLFTPKDHTDLSNPNHKFQVADLPLDRFGRRPMGITFDRRGNMFLTTRDLSMGQDDNGNEIFHDVLIGIDPVDGTFFNGNDKMTIYDLNVILSPTRQPLKNVLITDITFDHHNHLILFDAKTEKLYRLRPVLGFFDQFGDGLPSKISFPGKEIRDNPGQVRND